MTTPQVRQIEVRGVSATFAGRRALDGISVGLKAGGSTAIIGPNGAGKTTLLRVLAGLHDAPGGVFYDGEDIGAWSARRLARARAVIAQARPQVFDFTALELVMMGFHARASRWALPSHRERRRALEALAQVELAERAEQAASSMSGGELQRVLFAQAMVQEAGWWMLDEPTANLDPRHALSVLERVREHCASGGGAVAVLHELTWVERAFDEVVMLRAGRVVAAGPTHETMTAERLEEVYEVEVACVEHRGQRVWVVGG
ncbi:MAG: ABC transporter ATP-binding protein [Myxococcota bacterium]